MNYLDSKCLHELFDELDSLEIRKKDIKRYHDYPKHMTMEQALQEIEEEEIYIRAKIEELSIVQDDYYNEY